MEKLRTAAFIPLRGGSKSIPLKNIKEIAGKPLAFWVIEAALQCPAIDRVFVSTDYDEIAQTIHNIQHEKLEIVARSKKTATDTASTELALVEFAKQRSQYENIILIQATSPLIQTEDIEGGIKVFEEGMYDSVLSVVKQKRFIWEEEDGAAFAVNYNPLKRPRRQEFEGYLVENGAFYIMSRAGLLKHQNRLFGKIGLYEMPEESYLELDEPIDWLLVEKLLLERKKENIKSELNKIKLVVFDVDGVFTDGGVYVDDEGDERVKFSRIDGKGIELLNKSGRAVAIISAEDLESVRKRMQKLNIDEVHLGVRDKLKCLEELRQKYNLKTDEICFCGDDVQDVPVMRSVGVSMCPQNAVFEVKRTATYISSKSGGSGFVREVCNLFTS